MFAGSVARAGRVAAVASPSRGTKGSRERGSVKTTAPSQRSALSDVWSGVASDNAAALLPKASDTVPGSGGPGMQFAWGLGLIGISLLTLSAGLAAAEARRRKSRAG